LQGNLRRKKYYQSLSPVPKKIKGQALVELAIIVPFVALFIMLAIEMGRGVLLQVAVTNAAREGAYYLANNPGGDATTAVTKELEYTGLTNITVSPPTTSATIDQPVMVTVEACGENFPFVSLFAPQCGLDGINISSSAEMMVVR
jgi:hypothetical protein